MKRIIALSVILLASLSLHAQEFKGVATYEAKITLPEQVGEEKISEKIDDETDKLIKEAMASALHKTYTLTFDKIASLFVQEKKLAPVNPSLNISISIEDSADGTQYKNIKENRQVLETSLFEDEFLVSDVLNKYEWKLEREAKKIGSYTCYKATAVIKAEEIENETKGILDTKPKDTKITVWYTPDIPVGHGPANYWGLPGLILEANDGITTLVCSKIVLNSKDKTEIKAPKKGKKITASEFKKLEAKKMKEFEETHGNGEGQMIFIGG